jgi:ferredoxin
VKIEVDVEKCMGHGQCEIFAPEVFWIGNDDVVEVRREVDLGDPAAVEAVRTAAQNCPERVITLVEGTTADLEVAEPAAHADDAVELGLGQAVLDAPGETGDGPAR